MSSSARALFVAQRYFQRRRHHSARPDEVTYWHRWRDGADAETEPETDARHVPVSHGRDTATTGEHATPHAVVRERGAGAMKSLFLNLLTHPVLDPVVRRLRHGRATILMLHRFEATPADDDKISAGALRANLEYLRRHHYDLISLTSLVDTVRAGGTPPKNAVVFTVDDGYADFKEVAVPLFAAFDCPVTLFIATGPVDRAMWFWWDCISHAFANTPANHITLAVGRDNLTYHWESPAERRVSAVHLSEKLKLVPEQERLDVIELLCTHLRVDASGPSPDEYSTMTWDDVRALASSGLVDVAPHTVTHPILTRLTDQRMRWEIVESWRRLREECPAAIPLFCYPNGTPIDYSPATISALRDAGFLGAVTTEEGYVGRHSGQVDLPYRLPRFSCPNDVAHLAQIVNGLERAKMTLRALART